MGLVQCMHMWWAADVSVPLRSAILTDLILVNLMEKEHATIQCEH